MTKILSTGLIVLMVAIIGSVIGGVCICAYFYKESARKRRQVRPMNEPVARMVEPFSTKKLWERGRKRPAVTLVESDSINSISTNGIVTKGQASDTGDEEAVVEIGDGSGINPSSATAPSPVISGEIADGPPISPPAAGPALPAESPEPQKPNNTIPDVSIVTATVEVN